MISFPFLRFTSEEFSYNRLSMTEVKITEFSPFGVDVIAHDATPSKAIMRLLYLVNFLSILECNFAGSIIEKLA